MKTPKMPGEMISRMNAEKAGGKMMKRKAKHEKRSEKHEKMACKHCAKHKLHMKTEHKHK